MHHGIQINVDTWVGAFLAFGMMIPIAIACLAAGYIFCGFVLGRLGKTVLGIHLRHLFTRIAPSKFFSEDYASDRLFVETIVGERLRDETFLNSIKERLNA